MDPNALAFPILYAACQKVAKDRNEKFNSEIFAKQLRKYNRDGLRVAENKLAAMTPEVRAALIRQMGF